MMTKYERKIRERQLAKKTNVVNLATLTPLHTNTIPEQITVYRIETDIIVGGDECTFGPFTACCYDPSLERACWRYMDTLRSAPPEPHIDGISMRGDDVVFGFTMSDRAWMTWMPFRDVWEFMSAAGFKIRVYSVCITKMQVGKTQVAWSPRHATRIGELTYDELIEKYDEWREKEVA